ncbi:hypothetical protein pb186bvf_014724 [Paramecium bursaria]
MKTTMVLLLGQIIAQQLQFTRNIYEYQIMILNYFLIQSQCQSNLEKYIKFLQLCSNQINSMNFILVLGHSNYIPYVSISQVLKGGPL